MSLGRIKVIGDFRFPRLPYTHKGLDLDLDSLERDFYTRDTTVTLGSSS